MSDDSSDGDVEEFYSYHRNPEGYDEDYYYVAVAKPRDIENTQPTVAKTSQINIHQLFDGYFEVGFEAASCTTDVGAATSADPVPPVEDRESKNTVPVEAREKNTVLEVVPVEDRETVLLLGCCPVWTLQSCRTMFKAWIDNLLRRPAISHVILE